MEQNRFENSLSSESRPLSSTGCGLALALIGLGVWLVLVTSGAQIWMAFVEQDLMLKVHTPPDLRWLIIAVYGAAVGLPGLAVWLFTRGSRTGTVAKLFGLAGLFVILQAPARMVKIQDSQLSLVIQLMGILVFLLILGLNEARAGRWLCVPTSEGLGWALALSGMLGLPWVVLCALGSPLDTLLALVVGLAAGLAAVLALQPVLRQTSEQTYAYRDFFLDGLQAALFLLPAATALGANGTQAMLALVVTVLGWAVAGLSCTLPGKGSSNWTVPGLLLGLAFFWPMGFVDLEELLILLADVGEASQWAWLAAGIDLLLAGFTLVCAAALLRFWLSHKTARLAGWLLAGLVGGVLCAVYFLAGTPGFYGERLFVILKDQADLSAAGQIADPLERRKVVYQTLVQHADMTQAGMRASLDGLGVRYTPYYLVNALEVQGEPLFRFVYANRPEVDRVLIDTRLRPLPFGAAEESGSSVSAPEVPEWNLEMIEAPRVWDELKVTGEGIVIGQSDTGVQGDHPELLDGYLRRGQSDDYSWYDPWYGGSAPVDYGGHGTHALATALGQYVGVAPGASWIACVNLGRNLGNPALYLDCMQFHLAPFAQLGDPLHDGKPEWGANVLNNSWGCPEIEGCDARSMEAAAKALRAAGVFVAVSAGNDGEEGCSTVSSPLALYDAVTSVGAVDRDGDLASFSSLGPVTVDGSGRVKPDLLAPGVSIYSAYPGGGYTFMSGTSMAGPHVAGVVALMWSANPRLIGDIERTEQILQQTAQPYQGAVKMCGDNGLKNTAGYGIVDAYQAVLAALKQK